MHSTELSHLFCPLHQARTYSHHREFGRPFWILASCQSPWFSTLKCLTETPTNSEVAFRLRTFCDSDEQGLMWSQILLPCSRQNNLWGKATMADRNYLGVHTIQLRAMKDTFLPTTSDRAWKCLNFSKLRCKLQRASNPSHCHLKNALISLSTLSRHMACALLKYISSLWHLFPYEPHWEKPEDRKADYGFKELQLQAKLRKTSRWHFLIL